MIEIKDRSEEEEEEEKDMADEALTGLMGYVCDKLCRYPCVASSQEQLDRICAGCRAEEYASRILDGYNAVNDFDQTQEETGYRKHIMGRFMEVQ